MYPGTAGCDPTLLDVHEHASPEDEPTGPVPVGTIVAIQCDDGYANTMSLYTTCILSGSEMIWEASDGECVPGNKKSAEACLLNKGTVFHTYVKYPKAHTYIQ